MQLPEIHSIARPKLPFRLPTFIAELVIFALLLFLILWITLGRTNSIHQHSLPLPQDAFPTAVRANFLSTDFSSLPSNWMDRNDAQNQFFLGWCTTIHEEMCDIDQMERRSVILEDLNFRKGFIEHRNRAISNLNKANLSGVDLTGANFFAATLTGQNLSQSNLTNADHSEADLEGATFRDVQVSGANFDFANLAGVRMTGNSSSRVSFRGADLSDSVILFEDMKNVDFQGADLRNARLTNSTINADFSSSFENVTLMDGLDLTATTLRASLIGSASEQISLRNVNLLGVTEDRFAIHVDPASLKGTALQNLDLAETKSINTDPESLVETWDLVLRNSFADASVNLPHGVSPPCQWLNKISASQEEYFGTWRAWLELGGIDWPKFRGFEIQRIGNGSEGAAQTLVDVIALPGNIPNDCNWK